MSTVPVICYLEILSSMVFFVHPNLLHSAVICAWLPWSMSMCIRVSLFTVRLVLVLLLSQKKNICLVFIAFTFLLVLVLLLSQKKNICLVFIAFTFLCVSRSSACAHSSNLSVVGYLCLGLFVQRWVSFLYVL